MSRYCFAKYTRPRQIPVDAQPLPGVPRPLFAFDRDRSRLHLADGGMWLGLTVRMPGKRARLRELGVMVLPSGEVWMDHAGHEALERMLHWLRERLAGLEGGVERYDALWLLEAVRAGREGVRRWAPDRLRLVEVEVEVEDLEDESEAAQ